VEYTGEESWGSITHMIYLVDYCLKGCIEERKLKITTSGSTDRDCSISDFLKNVMPAFGAFTYKSVLETICRNQRLRVEISG